MTTEVTWVVLEGDGLAACLRCGDRTPLARLPMTITDFVKRLRAVSAMHAGCVEHVHSVLCVNRSDWPNCLGASNG